MQPQEKSLKDGLASLQKLFKTVSRETESGDMKSLIGDLNTMAGATQSGGYLLRTKIRAAIEFLDQLYQYEKTGKTTINELGKEVFTEEIPSLAEFE